MNAVGDGRKTAQKINDLLDKYKDNFSMIGVVITEEVVEAAAGNEGCGDQIMTILLDPLKNEVCKSISEEVIKAAAGNWQYGASILGLLFQADEEKVSKLISEFCRLALEGDHRSREFWLELETRLVELPHTIRYRINSGVLAERRSALLKDAQALRLAPPPAQSGS